MRAVWAELGAAVVAIVTVSIAHAETIAVTIDKIAYGPASVSAHVGDTIVWTNKDIVAHTATARDKQWDLMVLPNSTKSVVLKRAGKIDYYCKFHPNMTGVISVE